MRDLRRLPLLGLLLAASGLCWAGPDLALREQEIQQCRPEDIVTWRDGQDRPALASPLLLAYSHAGAPAWFSEAQVMAILERAAHSWSRCGVASRVSLLQPGQALPRGGVFVQWSEIGSAGNFGLANLSRRSLAMNPAMFALLRERKPSYPAEQTLQMVVSHEMGHFFRPDGAFAPLHRRHLVLHGRQGRRVSGGRPSPAQGLPRVPLGAAHGLRYRTLPARQPQAQAMRPQSGGNIQRS